MSNLIKINININKSWRYLSTDITDYRDIISWLGLLNSPVPTKNELVYFGRKRYELSDWLGNVRVVINDVKTPQDVCNTTVGYKAQVMEVRDYYGFGLDITDRTYSYMLPRFRYSFNGKEDVEQRWYQDYGARFYNKAMGRFISADPLIVGQKQYAWLSGYQFAGNTPIQALDRDGLEPAYFNYKSGFYTTAGDKLKRPLTQYEEKSIREQIKSEPAPFISEKIDMLLTGSTNIIFGGIGTLISVKYMVSTSGIGAGLGGSIALQLSLGQISIGITQVTGAFTEKEVPIAGSLPGYITMGYGNVKDNEFLQDITPFIDVTSNIMNVSLSSTKGIKEYFDNKNYKMNDYASRFLDFLSVKKGFENIKTNEQGNSNERKKNEQINKR